LEGLEQTVLACDPHTAVSRATGDAEEVLFVVAGHGELHLNGERHALAPETGVNLGPGQEYELRNQTSDPLRTVCVQVRGAANPQGGGAGVGGAGENAVADDGAPRTLVRHLSDQEAQDATTDRWFRIVADPGTGLRAATQFVGYIPTARAPEHFHTYDEVIYILDGEGAFHAGGVSRPVCAGSCIELPARTVHCLENTGRDVMRVVAVFRPPGSPAAAYYPDGTPAYPGTPTLTPDGGSAPVTP
jgi:mannose-6-phosphate isomerase-like protein (cupin superfamily)